MISAIKVWLWSEHEESFQKAFVANKKIESDSDCTWLLKVSVRKSVFALSRVYCEDKSFKKSVPKSEIATIVSQALANKVVVDSNMVSFNTYSIKILSDVKQLMIFYCFFKLSVEFISSDAWEFGVPSGFTPYGGTQSKNTGASLTCCTSVTALQCFRGIF